jgi:hypothetical protein
MSHYVSGGTLSYLDYLQAESLVGDVVGAARAIEHRVSKQTLEIIASTEDLQRHNIAVTRSISGGLEGIRNVLTEGFETVSYGLSAIASAVDEVNWALAALIRGVDRINASLDTLIDLKKKEAQTWAYNQYDIACDAFRRHLDPEALDALDRAINGLGSQTG